MSNKTPLSADVVDREAFIETAKCPQCNGGDNNPYINAEGISMRACHRCLIQWQFKPAQQPEQSEVCEVEGCYDPDCKLPHASPPSWKLKPATPPASEPSRDAVIAAAKRFFAEWKKDPDNQGETWGTANVLADFAAAELAAYRERLRAKVEDLRLHGSSGRELDISRKMVADVLRLIGEMK